MNSIARSPLPCWPTPGSIFPARGTTSPGFAVLGVTAALLGGIALLLERRAGPRFPGHRRRRRARPDIVNFHPAIRHPRARPGLRCFLPRQHPAVAADRCPVPNLLAILPAAAPGWRVDTSRDLYQFSDALKTEFLAQRTYIGQTAAGQTDVQPSTSPTGAPASPPSVA